MGRLAPYFRRARKLFHRRGLQRARFALVRALADRYLRVPQNVLSDYQFVLNEDQPAHLTPPAPRPLRINWILPGIASAQGGLFNIFRTIQQLEKWGHQNRIYLLPGGTNQRTRALRKNYFETNADIAVLSDDIQDSDALIATSWPTAYAARSIGNTAQKFYFIQDIEYMFYAPGSLHEFARNTYTFGFRGITAGSWIADVLRREFDMECSPFGFSYDCHAYSIMGTRMLPAQKKRVLFYARPETERRGFELGLFALAIIARRMPDVEFVLVGFPQGTIELPFPAIFSGVLPLSGLGALYRSCDVSLVLSHTNLSLLPLELMACGCVVVSNSGPNTEWLLSRDCCRLAALDPQLLAEAVIELLANDDERQQLRDAALTFVRSTDWTREIKAIESALFGAFTSADVER
jgi:O-antigen biosynthesis protein